MIAITTSLRTLPLAEKTMRWAAKIALQTLGFGDAHLSIAIVGPSTIKRLNSTYRGEENATDILSFPMSETPRVNRRKKLKGEPPVLLGDIVISGDALKKQAIRYKHTIKEEFCVLITHGILHLLGYSHASEPKKKAMLNREKAVLAQLLGEDKSRTLIERAHRK